MKGTHLEQIAHDYSKAQEQQTLLKEEIKRKKAMLRPMETKAKELEEEIEGELALYLPKGTFIYSCWTDVCVKGQKQLF